MPAHASPDAGQSEDPAGPLTRRRFLTYVIAAPVLTVAASGVMTHGKAYAVVPSPPQPENILDLGDVMVAAT
jgi:isoquinoline 1-oxidoreductase beta subunit